ncbi:biosynthetic peptidoglycan transglycosylase [Olivibacter sp. 47]|uniref:biosynthetic peptidoglycan transglycosylase n=1 Tax=Olivibacter sp. 47 TaxID=3056486 RepID=UPI0025A3B263|nr:biosynthetic peptidoglycan transglycosylase [Olivibacter sp. 47]
MRILRHEQWGGKESVNAEHDANYIPRIHSLTSKLQPFFQEIIVEDFAINGLHDFELNHKGKTIFRPGLVVCSKSTISLLKGEQNLLKIYFQGLDAKIEIDKSSIKMNTELRGSDISLHSLANDNLEFDKIAFNIEVFERNCVKNIDMKSLFVDGINVMSNITLNPDWLELTFKLDRVDFAYIKVFFKNFINRSIYDIDVGGFLEVSGRYKLSRSSPDQYQFDIDFADSEFELISLNSFKMSRSINSINYTLNEFGLHVDDRYTDTFLTFERYPVLLTRVVMMCEDPSFYFHNGIDIENIGFALATNIHLKKIARGASTITMQLSRNLFLNQNRNFYRKIEEVFISLIMENLICVPKEKIFEVYLNIIEFAPDIRGVKEASNFYFGKSVSELKLIEMITLTYIIPRPKHFFEALKIKSPILTVNLSKHVHSVLHRLKQQGIDLDKFGLWNDNNLEIEFTSDLGVLRLLRNT